MSTTDGPMKPAIQTTETAAGDPHGDALRELEQLLLRGSEILAVCGWNGSGWDAFRPGGIWVLKFRASALAFVERSCGTASPEARAMRARVDDARAIDRGYHVPEIVEALRMLYDAQCRDRVFHAAPALLFAAHGDLVELAETLANAGEVQAAARGAGVVLQKMLGRIAKTEGIEDAEPDVLADALFAAKRFDASTHLRIGACLQIARDLSGPRCASIPDAELQEMVRWVSEATRRFRWA